MGTSSRKVAMALWGNNLPERAPAELIRELYAAENQGIVGAVRLAGYGRHCLSGRKSTGLRLCL